MRTPEPRLTIKFYEKSNWRTLVRVQKKFEDGIDEATAATAEQIVADIRSNWSATQQHVGDGNPPAKDSTNLDTSITVETQGRDELGRFAKDGGTVRFIRVNTLDGDYPNGYNYAMALEDPAYYDLPFLAPALERADGTYSANIKRFVRL